MIIYNILKTKPHSERYLTRYVKFILSRRPRDGFLEKHHICPKANDLFPQFKSFVDHPWNKIDLTPREHYIAHLLLWKTFGGSQSKALWFMSSKNRARSSRLYENVKSDASKQTRHSLLGFKHSQKSKDNMAAGRPKKSLSVEVKVSKSRKPTEETKAKISAALKGRKLSEEAKLKISNGLLGNQNTLGKTW